METMVSTEHYPFDQWQHRPNVPHQYEYIDPNSHVLEINWVSKQTLHYMLTLNEYTCIIGTYPSDHLRNTDPMFQQHYEYMDPNNHVINLIPTQTLNFMLTSDSG